MNSATELVDKYLQLCEDRQLEKASEFLDPEIIMVFPGQRVYRTLEQMVQDAKGRYGWVKKNRTHFSSCSNGEDSFVTARGSLYGEALDGTAFADVRYIDFFVIRDNKIAEQHVWNDLAEVGITQPMKKEQS
jgi:hypothetical protein